MSELDQGDYKEKRLLLRQRQLSVIVLSLVLIFMVFQVGSCFADILRILGISVLLSYLFINVADFLSRHLRSRMAAVLLIYVVLFAITIIGAVIVVPELVYQISQLIASLFNGLPDAVQFIIQALSPIEARLHAARLNINSTDILNSVASGIPKPDASAIISQISGVAMSTMTWLLYGISIFVVSFYFLLEGNQLKDNLIAMCPVHLRPFLVVLSSDIDKNLQAFFRGQVVLGMGIGIIMLAIFLLLGIHYALLLSIFLAAWEIVPVIGPTIGFVPTILSVGIHGMSFPGNRVIQIIAITIIFNILQQIKDNVIAPRYIGNVIGLHPVLIFVAIMIGARLDGILGIIFSLPAACVLNVLATHLIFKSNSLNQEKFPDVPQ